MLSVHILNVVILCPLCRMSFNFNLTKCLPYMLSVYILSVIMLSVIMLSVIMLSVIMLSVIMLIVVAALTHRRKVNRQSMLWLV